MTKSQLDDLKVDELKKIAKEKGIAGADSMKKSDLIAAILGPENVKIKEDEKLPLNKVPGKYLKLNGFKKGEN